VRERVVRFGKNGLVGVLTEPDPNQRRADVPAIVFLNAGLLHRVGACRLHVRVARALAPLGFTSLRFDFSGMGDSEPPKDGLSFEETSVRESAEAMDYLEKARDARSFVFIGLCSGADMAYETARADPRVEAIGQLDAYVYHTWRYYLHRYGPRLLRAQTWRNVIVGKTGVGPYVRKFLKARGLAGNEDLAIDENLVISPYARAFPPKEQVVAGLNALVGRGVRLFNFFSNDYYLYRNQYVDCFREVPFRGQLRLEFIPGADHLVSNLAHQDYLIGALTDWVLSLRPPLARTAEPIGPLPDKARAIARS